MHVAIADTAIAVAVVTKIGGDALEVITPAIMRDMFGDLHDLPELLVTKGDGLSQVVGSGGAVLQPFR
jgi:hypothetical protein